MEEKEGNPAGCQEGISRHDIGLVFGSWLGLNLERFIFHSQGCFSKNAEQRKRLLLDVDLISLLKFRSYLSDGLDIQHDVRMSNLIQLFFFFPILQTRHSGTGDCWFS